MQIVIYGGFGYKNQAEREGMTLICGGWHFYTPIKFGDSSPKTMKDIQVDGRGGRGIQNIDVHLLRMSLPMFIQNLVTLA